MIKTINNHPYLVRNLAGNTLFSRRFFAGDQSDQAHNNSQQNKKSGATGNNLLKSHYSLPLLSKIAPNNKIVNPLIKRDKNPLREILLSNPKAPGSNQAPNAPITAAWETSRQNVAKNLNCSEESTNFITNNLLDKKR